MVKNHALKNTARARKAETGETLPEAMRKSATGAEEQSRFPVVHLGSGVYFDMNRESAHLSIVGSTNSGKTQLVRQILHELEGFDGNVTLITTEIHESLKNPRLVQIHSSQKEYSEVLESLSNMCRESGASDSPLDKPVVLIVDELTELSDEASIYLQMIYKWGSHLGIRVISTAFDKNVVPSVIRSNSSAIAVRSGGFGSLNSEEFFRIGAPKPTREEANSINVGDEAAWELDKGNLMILGSPGSGKTRLAQDMAQQALMNGKMVTVMTNESGKQEWEDAFGDAVELTTEVSATTMDALLFGFGAKRAGILIVDGIPDSYASDKAMTFNEQVAMSSLVSFIRGGHYPTVVIGHALPWFSSLFRSFVLKRNIEGTARGTERIATTLGVSIPKEVDLPNLSHEEGYMLNVDAKQTPPVKFALAS